MVRMGMNPCPTARVSDTLATEPHTGSLKYRQLLLTETRTDK